MKKMSSTVARFISEAVSGLITRLNHKKTPQQKRRFFLESLEERTLLSVSEPFGNSVAIQEGIPQQVLTSSVVTDTISLSEQSTALNDSINALLSGLGQNSKALTEDFVFSLNSNPGSEYTIYLDFRGHTTSGTPWNTTYTAGADIITPVYDTDGDQTFFSNSELLEIYEIWLRVSEDYAPFNVNVTTEIQEVSQFTDGKGVRCCIGGSSLDWFGENAGGVAFLDSFTSKADTPCFVFTKELSYSAKNIAEAATHEVGHTLGLHHDGTNDGTTTVEYYRGANGWAPIMGTGYYQPVTQWSKGEYLYANNQEDDLDIITTKNGFSYREDDHGDSFATATELTLTEEGFVGSGIIEQNTDVDYFKINLNGEKTSLVIGGITEITNLNALVKLYDDKLNIIAEYDPLTWTFVTIGLGSFDPGTYYFTVEGTGQPDGKGGYIYTDYGSLGCYTITTVPSQEEYIINDYENAYDGQEHTITIGGVKRGDTVTYSEDGKTFSETVITKKDAGTYTIYVQVTQSNGSQWTGEGTIQINQREITVDTTVDDKVYDGTTTATIKKGDTISGIIEGDDVIVSDPSGAFDGKNVGGYEVVVNYTLSGEDADNYFVKTEKIFAQITPRQITVSNTVVANKEFDGTRAATVALGIVDGIIAEDESLVTVSASGTFDTFEVGTRNATVEYNLSGSQLWNYITPVTEIIEAKILPTSSIKVTTADDVVDQMDEKISLREALVYTTAGGTITFDSALDGKTIELRLGELTIAQSVTVDATGCFKGLTIRGKQKTETDEGARVVSISGSDTVANLVGLTITGGKAENGAGIYLSSSTLNIVNCTLIGNTATTTGGALYTRDNGTVSLYNTVIAKNSAKYGAGIGNTNTALNIYSSTVTGNGSDTMTAGGGLWNDTGKVMVSNTILVLNRANTYADIFNENGSVEISSSLLRSEWETGTGNYLYDPEKPLFNDAEKDDYTISSDSQVFDIGNNDFASTEFDRLWNPRISGEAIDLGAYEYTVITNYDDIYDGKSHSISLDKAGFNETDKITYSVDQKTYTDILPTFADAGSYTVYVKVVRDYGNIWNGSGTVQIAQRQLTVEGTNVADKIYDGTTSAEITLGIVSNIVEGETVEVVASGSFDTKNVSQYDVNVSYTITGDAAKNYLAPVEETCNATISALQLEISETTADKDYDGTTAATIIVGELLNLIEGDQVTVTGTGEFSNKDANDYELSVSYSLEGQDAQNYLAPVNETISATIEKRLLTVTGTTVDNKDYDGNTTATVTNGTVSNLVEGETVELTSSGLFEQKDAGQWDVTVTYELSGDDAKNYKVDTETISATISPVQLTVSGTTVDDKSFDETTTATVHIGTVSGIVAGEEEIVSVTATGTFESSKIGTWNVTVEYALSGDGSGNYLAPVSETKTASILKSAQVTVTSVEDVTDSTDGKVTLREALTYVDEGGTIDFDSSLLGETITLVAGELNINQEVTIDGNQANLTISANDKSRIFSISNESSVTLKNLTLTEGTNQNGGLIWNEGTLLLSNLTLTEGTAKKQGGAIYNSVDASLEMDHTVLSGNTSNDIGGGIANWGSLRITESTINESSATNLGGGIANWGDLTIGSTLIQDNRAGSYGGGLFISAVAGTKTKPVTVVVYNSAIVDNETTVHNKNATQALSAGGGVFFLENNGSADITFSNVTIAGNSADRGGGYYQYADEGATFKNSIIAGNNASKENDIYANNEQSILALNVASTYSSWAEGSTKTIIAEGNTLFQDPASGDYSLKSGSEAVDVGDNSFVVDDKGEIYYYDLNGGIRILNHTVDLGAYEFVPEEMTIFAPLNAEEFLVALNDAQDGDVIQLAPGDVITLDAEVELSKAILIFGPGATFRGTGASRLFKVTAGTEDAPVEMTGITCTGGFGDNGGAIYVDGVLSSSGCYFVQNSAVNGGALYIHGVEDKTSGILFLNGCFITRNFTTAGNGGAIMNEKGIIVCNDTIFDSNWTSKGYNGGAILNAGLLKLTGGEITNNSTFDGNGGGIDNLKDGRLIINNVFFKGNSTGGTLQLSVDADFWGDGGAIQNWGEIFLGSCIFTGNTAGSGGAISNSGALIARNLTIGGEGEDDRNMARYGAGIINAGTMTLSADEEKGYFLNNVALCNGAAISNTNNGILTNNNFLSIDGYLFIGNETIQDAPVLYSALPVMTNSLMAVNSSVDLVATNSAPQNLTNGIIVNQMQLVIKNSTFAGSTAEGDNNQIVRNLAFGVSSLSSVTYTDQIKTPVADLADATDDVLVDVTSAVKRTVFGARAAVNPVLASVSTNSLYGDLTLIDEDWLDGIAKDVCRNDLSFSATDAGLVMDFATEEMGDDEALSLSLEDYWDAPQNIL